MMKDKINFFLAEKLKVHITKTDKSYLNGYFISEKQEGVYIFRDKIFGEMFLFLTDIYDVEEFREVKV